MVLSSSPYMRCFSSGGALRRAYGFSTGYHPLPGGGLPHSDIAGSPLALSSPTLFAVGHVLLRHATPRHPPHAFVSFFFCPPSHQQRHTTRSVAVEGSPYGSPPSAPPLGEMVPMIPHTGVRVLAGSGLIQKRRAVSLCSHHKDHARDETCLIPGSRVISGDEDSSWLFRCEGTTTHLRG